MGYTHYWTQKKSIKPADWKRIVSDVTEILAQSNVALAWEYDEPSKRPQLDDSTIRFNGVGDDGHETFIIYRARSKEKPRYKGDNRNWHFCKTAQKPYDVAVTAVLAYLASTTEAFDVSSDGEPSDWQGGIDLAKAATDKPVKLPAQVTA